MRAFDIATYGRPTSQSWGVPLTLVLEFGVLRPRIPAEVAEQFAKTVIKRQVFVVTITPEGSEE